MAHYKKDWEDLGQNIVRIIDQAVSEQDYSRLNNTVSQLIDKVVDTGSEAVRKAVEKGRVSNSRPKAETQKPKPLPVLYGKTSGKTAVGILKMIGGGLLSLSMLGLLISGTIIHMVVAEAILWFPIAVAALGLCGGMSLLGSGIRKLTGLGRFRTYCKTLGEKTHCTLEALAQSVGKSEKFVRREVKRMIREGLFLQGHLDKEQTRLITSHETYQQFEQSRLQLEQRQQQDARRKAERKAQNHSSQVQEVLDKGDAFLEEIRRCNDAIPGQEISEKISRMEQIVQRIFERVQTDPEIVPDLKKMMDYYLPMTVKLLNAYADMDAQPVQGDNIRTAKQEIEGTLDTLNLAFEKLLDQIFADTALDISSDISVLHTLLAQDGLTENDMRL